MILQRITHSINMRSLVKDCDQEILSEFKTQTTVNVEKFFLKWTDSFSLKYKSSLTINLLRFLLICTIRKI